MEGKLIRIPNNAVRVEKHVLEPVVYVVKIRIQGKM